MKLFRAQDEVGRRVVFFSEAARKAWISHNPEARRIIRWSEARRLPRPTVRIARFL